MGETDHVSHDAAIVSSQGADCISVIMADIPAKADDSCGCFAITPQVIYDHFNSVKRQIEKGLAPHR